MGGYTPITRQLWLERTSAARQAGAGPVTFALASPTTETRPPKLIAVTYQFSTDKVLQEMVSQSVHMQPRQAPVCAGYAPVLRRSCLTWHLLPDTGIAICRLSIVLNPVTEPTIRSSGWSRRCHTGLVGPHLPVAPCYRASATPPLPCPVPMPPRPSTATPGATCALGGCWRTWTRWRATWPSTTGVECILGLSQAWP